MGLLGACQRAFKSVGGGTSCSLERAVCITTRRWELSPQSTCLTCPEDGTQHATAWSSVLAVVQTPCFLRYYLLLFPSFHIKGFISLKEEGVLCHLPFNITLQKEEEKRDDHLFLIYALTEMRP